MVPLVWNQVANHENDWRLIWAAVHLLDDHRNSKFTEGENKMKKDEHLMLEKKLRELNDKFGMSVDDVEMTFTFSNKSKILPTGTFVKLKNHITVTKNVLMLLFFFMNLVAMCLTL
ncbi:MAG: hypothetical protein ORO03_00465 [Alphaproteobacteria bacterium]|nr:hypothetical protein [Alphaproteobacteria bacterium]